MIVDSALRKCKHTLGNNGTQGSIEQQVKNAQEFVRGVRKRQTHHFPVILFLTSYNRERRRI